MARAAIERFEAKYIPEPNSGCWLWTAAISSTGYGTMSLNNKSVRAHRWAYEWFVGPIPTGLYVCHRCDVRICVNPDHLFVGTCKDNVTDMWRKGRNAWTVDPTTRVIGERNGASKLTASAVRKIRHLHRKGRSRTYLSERFDVSCSSIKNIVTRATWRHVTSLPIDPETGCANE